MRRIARNLPADLALSIFLSLSLSICLNTIYMLWILGLVPNSCCLFSFFKKLFWYFFFTIIFKFITLKISLEWADTKNVCSSAWTKAPTRGSSSYGLQIHQHLLWHCKTTGTKRNSTTAPSEQIPGSEHCCKLASPSSRGSLPLFRRCVSKP